MYSNCLITALIYKIRHPDSTLMYFINKGRIHFYNYNNNKFIEFHNKKELSWYNHIWYNGRIRYIKQNSIYYEFYKTHGKKLI